MKPGVFISTSAVFIFLLCTIPFLQANSPDGAPENDPPVMPVEGELEINSIPAGADIFINNRYIGIAPVTVSIEPGIYRVTARKSGYRDESRWITVSEKGERVIFRLTPLTGYLNLDFHPPEASARTGSSRLNRGSNELPIGRHSVRILLFGYRPFEKTILIEEDLVSELTAELEKAPFSFSGLSASRFRFNPANPEALGTTAITFEVSAPGTGILEIHSPDSFGGPPVRSYRFPRFSTWNQRFLWDGKDDRGNFLPDGKYRIRISGTDLSGQEKADGAIFIDIDSTRTVRYRTLFNGSSGTWHAVFPDILPRGNGQVSFTALGTGTGEGYTVPLTAGVRFSPFEGTEISIQGGALLREPEDTGYFIALSAKRELFPLAFGRHSAPGGEKPPFFLLSAAGKLVFRHEGDSIIEAAGSLPAALRAGPFLAVLSPEYLFGYTISPRRVTGHGNLQGALAYDSGPLFIALSAKSSSFSIPEGYTAEAHWVLPGSSAVLSAFFTLDFSDSKFRPGGGAALGVLF